MLGRARFFAWVIAASGIASCIQVHVYARSLGLSDVLTIAEQRHIGLQRARLLGTQGDVVFEQDFGNYRPFLSVSGSYSLNQNNGALSYSSGDAPRQDTLFEPQLSLSQPTYWGVDFSSSISNWFFAAPGGSFDNAGATASLTGTWTLLGASHAQRKAQRLSTQRSATALSAEGEELRQSSWTAVLSAYWDWRVAHERLAISKQGFTLAEEQAKYIKGRIRVGLAAPSDSAQWSARMATATVELEQSKDGLIAAEQILRSQLQLADDEMLEPSGDWGPELYEALNIESLSVDNPALRRLKASAASSGFAAESARRLADPNVSISVSALGSYSSNTATGDTFFGSDEFRDYAATVQFSTPLGKNIQDYQETTFALAAQRQSLLAQESEINIGLQWDAVKKRLAIAQKRWTMQQDAVQKLRSALRIERRSFEQGRSVALNVIFAQERLLSGKRFEVSIRRQLLQSYLNVLTVCGRLNEWVDQTAR